MMLSVLRRISLRVLAPVVLCLPVVLTVLLLAFLGFWQGRSVAESLAREHLLEVHDRIDQRLSEFVQLPPRINRLNARLLKDGQLDPADLRRWRPWLYETVTSFDGLSGVLWGSAEDEVVWAFRYPAKQRYEFGIKDEQTGDEVHEYPIEANGQLAAEPSGRYEYHPRERPWFRDAESRGGPGWTEYAWVNEDGSEITYGLAHTLPYYNAAGTLQGVFDAELSLHDVSKFLSKLEVGKTGLAYVVDADGQLVANSIDLPVHDSDLNRIAALNSADERIAKSAALLTTAAGTAAEASSRSDEKPTSQTVIANGVRHLAIVSPIDPTTGLDWQIVTVVPESDFLAPVYEGRQQILLWGLGILVFTVGLGVVLASLSLQPLWRLMDHVRTVGSGKLDGTLALNYSPEFVRLSNEINRMTAGLRDRMRMRQALATAMEVQQNLLPSQTPEIDGFDIHGHSTYCDETGGDYYDYLDVAGLEGRSVAVAGGDVMGHGVAAAMLMATARGILRSRCQEPGSLGELLAHMNALLTTDTGGERFMTMLLMVLDRDREQLRWAAAGHDDPLIYDRSSDSFIDTATVGADTDGGLPLGILEGEQLYQERVYAQVRAGQIYLVATDGLWETGDAAGEIYGKDRLRELIRHHADEPAEAISRHIRTALATFRGSDSFDDDVTFVIVKVV